MAVYGVFFEIQSARASEGGIDGLMAEINYNTCLYHRHMSVPAAQMP